MGTTEDAERGARQRLDSGQEISDNDRYVLRQAIRRGGTSANRARRLLDEEDQQPSGGWLGGLFG